MTRVCLVGETEVNLRYELLSRETAREALSTYDLREPFENTVGVETVSLGAAVSLLNDLNWYLVRFVDEAMVLEPSVDDAEWLSRELATAIRDGDVDPETSDRFCKIYGLERVGEAAGEGQAAAGVDDDQPGTGTGDGQSGTESRAGHGADSGADPPESTAGASSSREERVRLVEPMYVTRTGGGLPDYDLRDVEETLIERVTEAEFGG